jgi:ubiquitin-like modifier-activating enzyme ATG7
MSAPAQAEADTSPLRFEPFSSAPAVGFWHSLARHKIAHIRLRTDVPVRLCGSYRPAPFKQPIVHHGSNTQPGTHDAGHAEKGGLSAASRTAAVVVADDEPLSALHASLLELTELAFFENDFSQECLEPDADLPIWPGTRAPPEMVPESPRPKPFDYLPGSASDTQQGEPLSLSKRCRGEMTMANTVEEYKRVDKKACFDRTAFLSWAAILGPNHPSVAALSKRQKQSALMPSSASSPDADRDQGDENSGPDDLHQLGHIYDALEDPTDALRFVCVCYPHLKEHRFYYWFAFPALVPAATKNAQCLRVPVFRNEKSDTSAEASDAALSDSASGNNGDFMPLLGRAWASSEMNGSNNLAAADADCAALDEAMREAGYPAAFFVLRDTTTTTQSQSQSSSRIRVFSLTDGAAYRKSCQAILGNKNNNPTIGFVDPGTLPNSPGWPLRNILVLARLRCAQALWGGGDGNGNGNGNGRESGCGQSNDVLDVICWRGSAFAHRLLRVRFPDPSDLASLSVESVPQSFGWEKNTRGKLAPRMIDTGATQDPLTLADNSADFNLKLMKWRMLPDLALERVKETKCLLFGGGTLGCNVARMLQSWGVRKITIVDNGAVSFSNPTRQSLFNFEDCYDSFADGEQMKTGQSEPPMVSVSGKANISVPRNAEGAKMKAPAAAAALRAIYPGTESEGLILTIPMPGHALARGEVEEARRSAAKIDELVQSHDLVFVLTDSRESRWFPTLVSAARNKLCLNAALGFDTFIVIRHGAVSDDSDGVGDGTDSDGVDGTGVDPGPPHLGCYFCNDVVAPQNSIRDRTLDQQCTVTRPGLSMAASALAVEIAVSILHHPLRQCAPATIMPGDFSERDGNTPDRSRTTLGTIPHSIRGFFSNFQQLSIPSAPFGCCPGCSPNVKRAYLEHSDSDERFEKFVRRVCDEPHYLEAVSGITAMKRQLDEEVDHWAVCSDGDDFDMDSD